jgi:hypothetical protein
VESSSTRKEDSPIPGKLSFSPSLDKRKSDENLIFGTWGLNDGNKKAKLHKDFLPSLLGINIPNPHPLIPIHEVEEGLVEGTSSSNPLAIIDIVSENMENNRNLSSIQLSKCNLRQRVKGTLYFLGKVEGDWVTLNQSKKVPHRGRKSFMSLAQKQASSEIECGKKLSLIGALRTNSPKEGLK